MSSAWEVYADQLFRRGHGMPLWDPEPTKGPVRIGDVGYLREGSFYRLFNATYPANDPINRYGVPENYRPFSYQEYTLNVREAALPSGPLCSRSVSAITAGVSAGFNASIGGAGVGIQFQCSDEQGALLVMKEAANRKELHPSRRMANYMRVNHQSWYTFATDRLDLDIAKEDIIFVRGSVQTAEWAVAAFVHEGRSTTLSFNGNFAAGANAAFFLDKSKEISVSPEYNAGPRSTRQQSRSSLQLIDSASGSEHEEDQLRQQCVFLHYYKLKMRFFWPRVMKAAAGSHELPPRDHDHPSPGGSADVTMDEMEIEQVPVHRNYDPLEYVLEYILQNSDAEVAIANDADILALCKDHEIPDDIPAFLRDIQPHIEVNEDGLGMISVEMLSAEVPMMPVPAVVSVDVSGADPSADSSVPTNNDTEEGHNDTHQEDHADRHNPGDKGKAVYRPGGRHGDVIILDDHTGGVSAIAFSTDGQFVASGSEDSTIILWDAQNGRKMHTLQSHTDTVCSLVFSPDSKELVSGARDNLAFIWTVETGEVRAVLEGHEGFVYSVAFSPDGKNIASASVDSTVRLWDTATGGLRWKSDDHHAVVMLVTFSPDGTRLVSASADYSARIWDTATGTMLSTLEGHEGVIYSMAFDPDGRRVVTGSDDGSCRIWNAQTGDELVTLREHTGSVWAAAFSAYGKRVLSAASDGTVKVCDSYSGDRLLVCEQSDALGTAAAFSQDGARICAASGDNAIRVWSARSGRSLATLEGHTDKVGHLRFSPDGDHIVSSSDDSTLRVWNIGQVVGIRDD